MHAPRPRITVGQEFTAELSDAQSLLPVQDVPSPPLSMSDTKKHSTD